MFLIIEIFLLFIYPQTNKIASDNFLAHFLIAMEWSENS